MSSNRSTTADTDLHDCTNQIRQPQIIILQSKPDEEQGIELLEVHFSPIGASIIRLLFPPDPKLTTCSQQPLQYTDDPNNTSNNNNNQKFSSDIVLHCENPLTDRNQAYFGAVVGRVANRIAKGAFELNNGTVYTLPQNNGEHCLHGGTFGEGFSHRCFEVEEMTTNSVTFTLISKDGDQGFPADIIVSVKYILSKNELTCEMSAKLLMMKDPEGKCIALETPINLAQHSYFNLGGHDCSNGILSHTLYLPSESYTPTDSTSIPTREVVLLDQVNVMDFRLKENSSKRVLSSALAEYGEAFSDLTIDEAMAAVARRNGKAKHSGEPFGFDHNYVVNKNAGADSENLILVGVVEHAASGRKMSVKTDAPGVQLYTSNYLDESLVGKDGVKYKQWQGLCLETQHFPDSIHLKNHDTNFSQGACFILRPKGSDYRHTVVYSFHRV